METITRFLQSDTVIFEIEDCLDIKKATLLARERGILGGFYIQHLIIGDTAEILYAHYGVNDKDKIISEIYPYKKLMNQ